MEVQKPIYDSMDIARTLYFQERKNAQNYADLISSDSNLFNQIMQSNAHAEKYRIYYLNDPNDTILIKNAFNGTSGTDIISTEKGDIIRAASPLNDKGRIAGVVVVESVIPSNVVSKMEAIQKAFNEYVQIKLQQNPVRFLYFLMLTVAALLIIFLALWVSLRIAKGITVPIQSLAEATNTVAHGDLDFRIDFVRDDDIGLLITSFPKMLDDIQQGKQSLEIAYKESDQRRLSMETILESINTGVIFSDRPGRVMTMNNAACSMLNMSRGDIEGRSYREILSRLKSDEVTAMVKRLSEKGFGSIEKDVHIYINGRPMDLRVYMTTIQNENNSFIGTLVVFDNLTEIIMAQRALAWQEVAKRIAHEIKNPLTPIRLSAERLLKKWNDKSDDFEEVMVRSTKTIVNEVNSLRSLVDEFSRFGKMPKISLEPMNIKSMIHEVVDLYSNVKDTELITTFSEDLPDIDVDRKQLKMAFINLIDNAIQAGTDKIWVNASFYASMDMIRIEVKDNGTGINAEDKEKLFFPYFSTKKEGTGLGLAIVNSIISKHRGYIRVQDNEPSGSVFIIELPVGQK
jgi:two-component system nitrogen regulation sensor histidine kinase NtrY